RIHHAVNDRWGLFQTLATIAQLEAETDPPRAARLLGASDAVRARLGVEMPPPLRPAYEQTAADARERLGETGFEAAWKSGAAMPIAEAVRFAGDAATAFSRNATVSTETPARPSAPDLRVLTLGPFEVVRKGKRLPARAWGSSKARELFVFLACHPEG